MSYNSQDLWGSNSQNFTASLDFTEVNSQPINPELQRILPPTPESVNRNVRISFSILYFANSPS